MNRIQKIRWRWVISGGLLWLILASSISLEDGHSTTAQWGAGAAVTVAVLAAATIALRLLARSTMAVARYCWRTTGKMYRPDTKPRR